MIKCYSFSVKIASGQSPCHTFQAGVSVRENTWQDCRGRIVEAGSSRAIGSSFLNRESQQQIALVIASPVVQVPQEHFAMSSNTLHLLVGILAFLGVYQEDVTATTIRTENRTGRELLALYKVVNQLKAARGGGTGARRRTVKYPRQSSKTSQVLQTEIRVMEASVPACEYWCL